MAKLIDRSNSFKKDYKTLKKRNKDLEKLRVIIELLVTGAPLPHNANPHKLKGEYNGLWECHIEGDWVMIYSYDDEYVNLIRTGAHKDLFKKYS